MCNTGKVLCLQMSHVSVSICVTDTLKCGDVVANVIQSVAYGKLDVGAAEVG